jgi:hypothetical protein
MRLFYWIDSNSNNGGIFYANYPKNQWVHYVCLYNGTQTLIYENTELVATLNSPKAPYSTGYLQIGNCDSNSTVGILKNVYLRDLRIYDNALTELQIKELSKGKILHLPLNNISRDSSNLVQSSFLDWQQKTASGNFNNCLVIGYVLTNGLSVGDVVRVTVSCKWKNITYPESDTETVHKVNLQGYGDVTNWSSGRFNSSQGVIIPEGDFTYDYNYTFTITEDHLKNTIWTVQMRHDYLKGYFYYKQFKVCKDTAPTAFAPSWDDTISFFDENEYDISGFNNNLITTKTVTPIAISGGGINAPKYSNCYHFDGTQRLYGSVNIGNVYTYSVWFNLDTSQNSDCWVLSLNDSSVTTVQLGVGYTRSTKKIIFYINNATKTYSNAINLNTWYHLAISYDGVTAKLYLNGEKVDSLSTTNTYTKRTNFNIGCRSNATNNSSGAYFFKGYISDCIIYSTVLSDDDIKEIYNKRFSIDTNGNFVTYGELVEE